MEFLSSVIGTGFIVGIFYFFIKSLFSSEVSKMFISRWEYMLGEGLLILFMSTVLAFTINFVIATDENVSIFLKNVFTNAISTIVTLLSLILLKLSKYIKKGKWLNEIKTKEVLSVLFMLGGIVLFSSVLVILGNDKTIASYFVAKSIILSIMTFFLFIIVTLINQHNKAQYKVSILRENDLNGLYYKETIDKNVQVFFKNPSDEKSLDSFYLYYLNEKKLYKYARTRSENDFYD